MGLLRNDAVWVENIDAHGDERGGSEMISLAWEGTQRESEETDKRR